jgi:nucleoside-diphosphate kinase
VENKSSKERTLVLLKPDAVQRNLVGEIIKRFEQVGLKIVGLKLVHPTREQAWKHYVKSDAEITALGERSIEGKKKWGVEVHDDPTELGRKIVDRLVKFLTASPIVAMVLEGNKSVPLVRKLVGSTEPLQSDVGTVRGDFTLDSYEISDNGDRAVRNLVHAASSVEDAVYEINVWFKPNELLNYKHIRETVLYDVNFDTINE